MGHIGQTPSPLPQVVLANKVFFFGIKLNPFVSMLSDWFGAVSKLNSYETTWLYSLKYLLSRLL